MILRSNLAIALLYFFVGVSPTPWRNQNSICMYAAYLCTFIILHFVVTVMKSVPDDTSTPEEP